MRRQKPVACAGCPLYGAGGPVVLRRDGTVGGAGSLAAKLMLVGEATGGHEQSVNEPFTGPAGSVLNIALRAAGVRRADCYVTNVVKCWPVVMAGGKTKTRPPTAAEIKFCRERWFDQELELFEGTTLVPLGQVAFNAVMGPGPKRQITEWRGARVVRPEEG